MQHVPGRAGTLPPPPPCKGRNPGSSPPPHSPALQSLTPEGNLHRAAMFSGKHPLFWRGGRVGAGWGRGKTHEAAVDPSFETYASLSG